MARLEPRMQLLPVQALGPWLVFAMPWLNGRKAVDFIKIHPINYIQP